MIFRFNKGLNDNYYQNCIDVIGMIGGITKTAILLLQLNTVWLVLLIMALHFVTFTISLLYYLHKMAENCKNMILVIVYFNYIILMKA